MTTAQEQLRDAVENNGEKVEDLLICFYEGPVDYSYDGPPIPITECSFEELPTRKFNPGYGGVEGETVIAFSERYVYIKGCYDGQEWMEAIPRHPEVVSNGIPIVGGG